MGQKLSGETVAFGGRLRTRKWVQTESQVNVRYWHVVPDESCLGVHIMSVRRMSMISPKHDKPDAMT